MDSSSEDEPPPRSSKRPRSAGEDDVTLSVPESSGSKMMLISSHGRVQNKYGKRYITSDWKKGGKYGALCKQTPSRNPSLLVAQSGVL